MPHFGVELQTILHIQGLDRDGKTGLGWSLADGGDGGCVDFTCIVGSVNWPLYSGAGPNCQKGRWEKGTRSGVSVKQVHTVSER